MWKINNGIFGSIGNLLPRNNHIFFIEYNVTPCWYVMGNWNTSICKKLHGNVFKGFIINARTDRYNIMCSIDTYVREDQ